MPPKPQSLNSNSINPANLVELQVLTNVVAQLQKKDIQSSIPYLAKIVQIIENQRVEKPTDPLLKPNYYKQLNELKKIKADAYANLADAYFQTQQFVLCESSLLFSVKIWENFIKHVPSELEPSQTHLKVAYQQLFEAYQAIGKPHLAQHIATKLSKLE